KAAAATAVVMEKCSAISIKPIELNFNRPFVYALVDAETGIPLFIGEVRKIN
ncbi:MAG: proteinase inhibitor I4 serpin, partial [Eubacterium sp.]|nr:proteinase inhibitor I4 serpin [Eubacterium sp.]